MTTKTDKNIILSIFVLKNSGIHKLLNHQNNLNLSAQEEKILKIEAMIEIFEKDNTKETENTMGQIELLSETKAIKQKNLILILTIENVKFSQNNDLYNYHAEIPCFKSKLKELVSNEWIIKFIFEITAKYDKKSNEEEVYTINTELEFSRLNFHLIGKMSFIKVEREIVQANLIKIFLNNHNNDVNLSEESLKEININEECITKLFKLAGKIYFNFKKINYFLFLKKDENNKINSLKSSIRLNQNQYLQILGDSMSEIGKYIKNIYEIYKELNKLNLKLKKRNNIKDVYLDLNLINLLENFVLILLKKICYEDYFWLVFYIKFVNSKKNNQEEYLNEVKQFQEFLKSEFSDEIRKEFIDYLKLNLLNLEEINDAELIRSKLEEIEKFGISKLFDDSNKFYYNIENFQQLFNEIDDSYNFLFKTNLTNIELKQEKYEKELESSGNMVISKIKNNINKLDFLFKFSILRTNLEYEYSYLTENPIHKKKKQKFLIDNEYYLIFSRKEQADVDFEYHEFELEIIKESLDLLEEIFKGLEKEDDLFNYLCFLFSDIEYNLDGICVYSFDYKKTFENVKKELIESIFDGVVFYVEDLKKNKFKNKPKTNAYVEPKYWRGVAINLDLLFADFDNTNKDLYVVKTILLLLHEMAHVIFMDAKMILSRVVH